MARKLIKTESYTDKQGLEHAAKVYRDAEWNEYRVTFWVGNQRVLNSDMHTDDKQDALDTAKLHIKKIAEIM